MEGTIAIQEKRSVVDKFKSWYKEKLIDTGHSAKIEEGLETVIDVGADAFTLYCVVAGAAITIIGAIPSMGLGLALGGAIGTGIVSIGSAVAHFGKKFAPKVIIGGKRAMEAIIIGEDGSSKNVKIPNIDLTEDAKELGKVVIKEGTKIATEYENHKTTQNANSATAETQTEITNSYEVNNIDAAETTDTASMKM